MTKNNMNAVTKARLSFFLRTTDAEKKKVIINNETVYEYTVLITGIYRTTWRRYTSYVKEVLNERYSTVTHVLNDDVQWNMVEENQCVLKFVMKYR